MKTNSHRIGSAWLIGILLIGVAIPAKLILAKPAPAIERNHRARVSERDDERSSLLQAYKRSEIGDENPLAFSSLNQLSAIDGETFDEEKVRSCR